MNPLQRLMLFVLLCAIQGVQGQDLTNLYSFSDAAGQYPVAGLTLAGTKLYGTTSQGGDYTCGTIFSVNPDGSGFTVLHAFSGADGAQPAGQLLVSGSTLYGVTQNGGDSYNGTVFAIGTDGTGYTNLFSFSGSDGANPLGGLVLSGGVLYGTASSGGANWYGVVFSVNVDGTGYVDLHDFSGVDGQNPIGEMVLDGSTLYGVTQNGGDNSSGNLFAIGTDGSGCTNLHSFNGTDGANPLGGVVLSGGTLSGTTSSGGANGCGVVFSVNVDGTGYVDLHDFTWGDGQSPAGRLAVYTNALHAVAFGTASSGGGAGQGVIFQVNLDGSDFRDLYQFTGGDNGGSPQGALSLSAEGLLYGTTFSGGTHGNGSVYSLAIPVLPLADVIITTPATDSLALDAGGTVQGIVTAISPVTGVYYSFNGGSWTLASTTDGWSNWSASVTYTTGTNILSAYAMGTNGPISLTNSIRVSFGVLYPLHVFGSGDDGGGPSTGLLELGGKFYGICRFGGSSGLGTVFSVNTDGSGYAELHSFSGDADGSAPQGKLAVSGNTLYGTTLYGGSNYCGTVFSLHDDGSHYTILRVFADSDGAYPQAGVIISNDVLYGTTSNGGQNERGTVFALNVTNLTFNTLHKFTGGPDGRNPLSGLTLSSNGLYGTTSSGGTAGCGTVFSLQTDGSGFAVLHHFQGNPDGNRPQGGLLISEARLYGTTFYGGVDDNGTVYAVNLDGSGYSVLYRFKGNPDGSIPQGDLLLKGGLLFGITSFGGAGGAGTIFVIDTEGTFYGRLWDFNNTAANPEAGLVLSGSTLYGTTTWGGAGGQGVLFMLDSAVYSPMMTSPAANELVFHASGFISGSQITNLLNTNASVARVYYSLNGGTWAVAGTTNGWSDWTIATGFIFVTNTLALYAADDLGHQSPIATYPFYHTHFMRPMAQASIFASGYVIGGTAETNVPVAGVYYSLNGGEWNLAATTNGWYDWYSPVAPVLSPGINTLSAYVKDTLGNNEATNTIQTLFVVSPVIRNFGGVMESPKGHLEQLDGKIYGMAGNYLYSINVDGTGFGQVNSNAIDPAVWGVVSDGSRLYGSTGSKVFAINTDGSGYATLLTGLQGAAGLAVSGDTLYGVTDDGDPAGGVGPGTVFSVQTDGSGFARLHAFRGSDGDSPRAAVIVDRDTIYGTTTGGGTNGSGTVFSMKTNGAAFTVLANIPGDGITSESALTLDGDTLYGVCQGNSSGKVFAVKTNVTGFTTLYQYPSSLGGFSGQKGALAVVGSALYAAQVDSGFCGKGLLYSIRTNGTGYTEIYHFAGTPDGDYPNSDLLLVSNQIYGVTEQGGINDSGAFYVVNLPNELTATNLTFYRNYQIAWQLRVSDLFANVGNSASLSFDLASIGTSTNGIVPAVSGGYLQYSNPNLVDDLFTYTVTNCLGGNATGVITLKAVSAQLPGGIVNQLGVDGGVATISFCGVPVLLYQVQVSTDLVSWTTLETTNAPPSGRFQYIDLDPPWPCGFYRLNWNGD
ncbi:MAG: choice-of-anchor tandem repeat GloVer-containing protein [bacterium]